ncbi:mandelate racemase/muconate lactonizing enzyme family protein [Anaerosphaera multitolerans]|uniref:Dipeptide epimerase n=1 Tax=Anaerosphaera multitolerans TaxID=2487351 RepID=A0A437S5U4_9FIRM|nr:dipeptide epimerase [Anaerosphaera multitolerans]RVU54403.1 dipeptide epimerase [Anaerosphaera multitolerans]
MIITDLKWREMEPVSKVKFKIALRENAKTSSLLLKIETDEGISGYGEASPFEPVTGDNIEDIKAFFEKIKPELIGKNPLAIEKIHRIMNRFIVGKTAGKAAIDFALYDILGKKTGMPLYMLLGGNSNTVQSDMTIGIDTPDEMAKLAKKYVNEGFNILKIKVGLNYEEDLEAIRKIREAVGDKISIRLDANQGYDKKQTINVMREMEKYSVEEIEQPIPCWDFDGMKFIKDRITQELMMDESVHSPNDAHRAVKEEACDVINIKLMKAGGIFPALQINAVAQAAGIKCMIGCMSETRVGIAAGAALAAAKKNIVYADLDSYRMIEELEYVSGGYTQEGDIITLTEKPGLGLEIDF